ARDCALGDLREGVVTARNGGILNVDVGLESLVECHGALPVGTRVTVKLTSIKELAGELVDRTKISISRNSGAPIYSMPNGIYWGYGVHKAASLAKLLNDQHWDLRVGTSRYG